MTKYPSIAARRLALEKENPIWGNETIDALFHRAAQKYADRTYVIADDGERSYSAMAEQADLLAKGLRLLGVGYQDRIALVMANYGAFPALALAAWRLGAAVIPVNFAYKANELDYVIRQSKCKIVISMESYRDSNYFHMLDQVAPHWEQSPADHYPNLERVIQFKGTRDGVMSVEQLMLLGTQDPTPLAPNPAKSSDTAIIMYTSGTTGAPKGVLHSHDQQLRETYTVALHRAYEDGRKIIFALPLYHAFGLSLGLIACIWVGGSAILRPVFDAEDMMANITKYKPTDILLVPTMALAIIDHPNLPKYDLSSLYACLCGAAATPRRVWEKLISGLAVTEVVAGYGMTELTAAVLMTAPDGDIEQLENTVGHIMKGGSSGMQEHDQAIARMRIVDPESYEDVSEGSEGELVWLTPVATSAYFDMPEATQHLFTADGWLKSGDLGRLRKDGYVQLTGRSKDQYKSGGELVSPREVENVLDSHPQVAQSYVFGIKDDKWGEIGAAYVVPLLGESPNATELQAWCQERLAKYKWPRHIFFCSSEELPKTATGKVQKFLLINMANKALGL